MIRTFLIGVVLGAVAAAGALYAYPAVDQVREPSLVAVAPNGDNSEMFHINVPMDRVLVGAAGEADAVPAGLDWPQDPTLAGVRPEIFKLRDARDNVVGVAARTAIRRADEDIIDWVLHLPARGSLFTSMDSELRADGYRAGVIRAGSREFDNLQGSLTEQWVADTSGKVDAPQGRIELSATYIGKPNRAAAAQDAVE